MGDDEEFDFDIPLYKLINPTDYLPLFEGQKPKFSPGEKTSYSNGGFVLLGAIIEKVTGEHYRDFITENILIPCNMTDSGFYFMNDLPVNSAIGYKEENDKLIANYFSIPIVGGADGGIFSTSHDMVKLWNNFADYKILSEELTNIYMTPASKLWESDYGLGVYLSGDEKNRELFLYGCDPGVGFHSRFNIKTRRVINILSNRTWGIEDISNAFWDSDL